MTIIVGGRECVRGIDVSRWQGNVIWPQVKAAGVEFAFIKAGGADGGLYSDGWYLSNKVAAKNAGMPIGAYYFMHPSFSGAQQANHFCNLVGNYDLELPPTLDVETQGLTTQHVIDFISVLDQRIGKRWIGPTGKPVSCIIYSGAPFANILHGFQDWDLWLAAYTNPNYPNPNPAGTIFTNLAVARSIANWPAWSIWQAYGGDGRTPGVNGGCDNDVGTVEWFNRTLGHNSGGKDWLDMATMEEVEKASAKALKNLILNDAEVGSKIAYWVLRAVAEGQPEALAKDLPDLKKLVDQLTTNSKDPVNNPTKADKLDWIVTATGAHA